MDDEEIFTASFPAGRKQIFVDVKENNIGKYLKIKERGDSQTNSILIPGGSIVQLRNALDEAVQALGLDSGKGGGGGKRVAGNQCVCHVGNLSWDTTDDTLHDLFSGYGEVVKAEVQMSRAGRSQGWGLVEFASAAEVEYAISQCDGLDLDGREIRVRADKGSGTGPTGHAAKAAMPKKTRRNVADKVVDPHRIFIMNLNSTRRRTISRTTARRRARSPPSSSSRAAGPSGPRARPSSSTATPRPPPPPWTRSRARSSTGATCACGRTSRTECSAPMMTKNP